MYVRDMYVRVRECAPHFRQASQCCPPFPRNLKLQDFQITCVKTQKRKRLQRRFAEQREMAAVLSERAAASAALKHHALTILAVQ